MKLGSPSPEDQTQALAVFCRDLGPRLSWSLKTPREFKKAALQALLRAPKELRLLEVIFYIKLSWVFLMAGGFWSPCRSRVKMVPSARLGQSRPE